MKEAIEVENIQVKLVSNKKGFNQIDKRWTDKYKELWGMPDNIVNIIKRYCGEIAPNILYPKDKRRINMNEFSKEEQKELINWIGDNKTLIVSDMLKGRGKFSAEWMLVTQKMEKNAKWIIKPINFVMNYYSNGDIIITKRGVVHIGRITMQRKGGDGGRSTANMLHI